MVHDAPASRGGLEDQIVVGNRLAFDFPNLHDGRTNWSRLSTESKHFSVFAGCKLFRARAVIHKNQNIGVGTEFRWLPKFRGGLGSLNCGGTVPFQASGDVS